MVLFILLVATANLCLGFGLAVYLGRRCRSAFEADDPWSTGPALGQSIDGMLAGEPNLAAGVEILTHQPPEQQSAEPTTDTTPDQVSDASTDPPADQTDPAESSPSPQPNKTPSERAVEDLSNEVQQYHGQVTLADEKLQACAEDPDAAEIEAILGSLKDSTVQYLESRNRAHGTFRDLRQGQPEISGVCDDLRAAIERENQQIEDTCTVIEGFDYENRLEEGCRQMSEKTARLIDSSDRLRETLERVEVKLGRNEQRPRQLSPETQSDAPGERSDRTELEEELLKWWPKGPDGTPQLSVAMIELDDFSGLEQQHGPEVAEVILRAVGQLLESEVGGESRFFELPGRRLLLLFPEADTDSAANTGDRLRQMIEKAHLRHGQSEIRVTVSCAVAGARSEEAPAALIQRAEATLQEAKRYGSNRTFSHDGKFPAPVVPPNFSLEEKQITL